MVPATADFEERLMQEIIHCYDLTFDDMNRLTIMPSRGAPAMTELKNPPFCIQFPGVTQVTPEQEKVIHKLVAVLQAHYPRGY